MTDNLTIEMLQEMILRLSVYQPNSVEKIYVWSNGIPGEPYTHKNRMVIHPTDWDTILVQAGKEKTYLSAQFAGIPVDFVDGDPKLLLEAIEYVYGPIIDVDFDQIQWKDTYGELIIRHWIPAGMHTFRFGNHEHKYSEPREKP